MAPVKYLLDTNVLSELIKPKPNPQVARLLSLHGTACSTASVVWQELWFGCLRLPPSHRRQIIESYLSRLGASQLPVLAYDSTSAKIHAHLRADLSARGLAASHADGEIASVALRWGLKVVSRNVRHFEVFPDLLVENWFE